MTSEPTNGERAEPEIRPKRFEASPLWISNRWGATYAIIGATILFLTISGVAFWIADATTTRLYLVSFVALALLSVMCFFPGNLVVASPVAVEVHPGKGITIYGPLKALFISIEDIANVEYSFWKPGTIIRLNRRYGLLKSFALHWGFGSERTQAARAIEVEIARRSKESR